MTPNPTTLRQAIDEVYGAIPAIPANTLIFSSINTSPVALTKGMPIRIQSSDGSIKRGRALGTVDAERRVVGLLLDEGVAINAVGRVQMAGLITATTAQWDSITGQSGGLTPGALYYLSGEFGMMSTSTPDPTAYADPWIIEMGVAQDATDFMIRIQTMVQL